jgi:hypothetical protein
VTRAHRHAPLPASATGHSVAACVLVLALLLETLPAAEARAGTRVPYGGEFRAAIEDTFFEPDYVDTDDLMRLSQAKVRAYRELVHKKLRFLTSHVFNSERIDNRRDKARAHEKALTTDKSIALQHILRLLDRISETRDPAEAYRVAADILSIEYATRSFHDPLSSIKVPIHLNNILFDWSLENKTRARNARHEASNLVNPETGEFYTPEELRALIRAGVDLSTLNPPSESPFWSAKEDISSLDIASHYLGCGDALHRGLTAHFPELDDPEVTFRRSHRTQSKPKIDVSFTDQECLRTKKGKKSRKKCQRKLKLKLGMETHSDPTANSLLSALGYNVDLTVHLKRVRMYMGKSSIDELEAEWIGYFDRQRLHTYIPLETVLREGDAGRGRDDKGEYLVFAEAGAETKFDDIDRIGFFAFSSGMPAQLREARALFLFNTWIANSDMKDEENNKLSLRKNENGEYQIYMTQHDIGHSLGLVLPERVEAFPWDAVETSALSRFFGWTRGRMELNYFDLQNVGLTETATYADAKWMARLIAQLTREQIEDAVALGRWPDAVARLYVEKLINRRNGLVTAFGLEDEFPLLPVDRHLTTEDGAVVDGRLMQSKFKDASIDYGGHLRALLLPVRRYVADRTKMTIQIGLSAIDVIDPGDIRISGRATVTPEILVRFSRRIQFNPEPEGRFDQYIVEDAMHLGLRPLVGYVANAEVGWIQKYTLAYPVATLSEGVNSRNRVANLLLPYDIRRGKLPDKYVLARETAWSAGLQIRTEDASLVNWAGITLGERWVWARRSVIDHREIDPIVWTDRPSYLEGEARAFLKALVLEIPVLVGKSSAGSLHGEGFRLDAAKLSQGAEDSLGFFDRAVRRNDFSDLSRIRKGPARDATSKFKSRSLRWNLFLARSNSGVREDRVTLRNQDGTLLREEFQVERHKLRSWSFVDNGETRQLSVEGFLGAPEPGDAVTLRPIVVVRYDLDDLNTHSDELDRYYDFLVGLGAGHPFMPEDFSAQEWNVNPETNGRWGRLLAGASVHLHSEALERLLALDEDRYWRLLAEHLEVPEDRLTRHRRQMHSASPKRRLLLRRSSFGRRVNSAVLHSTRILGILRRAQLAKNENGQENEEEILSRLVHAIYLANSESRGSYDPLLMGTLLEAIGLDELASRKQVFISGRITKPLESELILPERTALVGVIGEQQSFQQLRYRFFPSNGIELYRMLDWVRATER